MKRPNKTAKNIQAINRRAATLAKLFGVESKEYQEFTARMAGVVGAPDIYVNNKGIVQIRNTKSARANYRKVSALAKRVQKTPTSVLKRKAEKQRQDFTDEYYSENHYEEYDGFIDYETYRKWVAQFNEYYQSCYVLAQLLVPDEDVQWYAAMLYENDDAYRDNWNYAYKTGAFDEWKDAAQEYENDGINNNYVSNPETGDIYGVDPVTGEVIENPDFYE